MKYCIQDPAFRAAAEEISGKFGFTLEEGGLPVEICLGKQNRILYDGAKLCIEAQKKVLVFAMLKRFSDRAPAAPYEEKLEEHFSDLTYMLDCSRNAVAKPETVEELIRHLAVLGYDSLGLYMEDTFLVPAYPYFGYLRNGYSPEDIARMQAACERFGMELVPYIQTLAHFGTLLRHYAMGHLFDTGDILLVGEEETYRFIEALISTCSKLFHSKEINIGMDEAYMLGRGAYMDKHGARSRFDIMAEHLTKVLAICKKYGYEHPMMWSDMFFSLALNAQYEAGIPAELAARIPKDVELIYWDYCSTSEAHYTEMIRKHKRFENRIGFAGGAWKWLGYTPDNRYSFVSNGEAARACIKEGIGRFIVTGWGDNGADCSPFATLPALLACGRMNFGEFEQDEDFAKAFFTLTGIALCDFMAIDLCNRVTRNDDVEEKNSANKYLLFNDILLGTLDTTIDDGLGGLYGEHAEKLAAAEKRGGAWAYLFTTQRTLAELLAIKSEIGVTLRRAYASGDKKALARELARLKQLPALIEAFYEALRAQWERENRPNGFDVQDLRIGALKQRVQTAIRKVSAYLDGEAPSVPELGEKLLDFMGHNEEFEKDYDQCEWRWRRMTSVNVNE